MIKINDGRTHKQTNEREILKKAKKIEITN
jgi:hypothetical protein